MSTRTRILVVGLVASFIFPLAAQAADPARAEQLTVLFEELKKSAADRLARKSFDKSAETKTNALVYDEQSITDLKTVLEVKSNDPTSIYAARVLLQPILRAKPEVIKAAIPEVDRIRKKIGRYKSFKQYRDTELKKLQFPEFKKGVSAEAMLKAMNKVQKLRDKKLDKETPIKMHNLELHRIVGTQIQLILTARDVKEDKKLFVLFRELDKKKLEDCFAVTANISRYAKGMKVERARTIRDQCIKLGNKLKVVRREYACPTLMALHPAANSGIVKRNNYPGINLLTCANAINKIIGDPAIKVPTVAEVNKYIADKNKGKGK